MAIFTHQEGADLKIFLLESPLHWVPLTEKVSKKLRLLADSFPGREEGENGIMPWSGGSRGRTWEEQDSKVVIFICLNLSQILNLLSLDISLPDYPDLRHLLKWPEAQVRGLLMLSKVEVKWNLWEMWCKGLHLGQWLLFREFYTWEQITGQWMSVTAGW